MKVSARIDNAFWVGVAVGNLIAMGSVLLTAAKLGQAIACYTVALAVSAFRWRRLGADERDE